MFSSVEETRHALAAQGYFADESLSVVLFLALKMQRPLLLEGAPGVGKTELAKVVSRALNTELIRLQCFEGLDVEQAAYEWNYPRQLLEIQALAASGQSAEVPALYRRELLLQRPLLRAIDASRQAAPVLLIDELDRADEEFESFLLELLGEFQITIPELGTLKARHTPIVLLTSNRTREVHDALKRRCLYHWIGYPSQERELRILQRKVEGVSTGLAQQVARFAAELRKQSLYKSPGVAESIDWATALLHLGVNSLSEASVRATAGALLKVEQDVERLQSRLACEILATIGQDPAAPDSKSQ